jgi:hypothetical protein
MGIRTHDPGFRASEDSTRLRPFGYRDRQLMQLVTTRLLLGVKRVLENLTSSIRTQTYSERLD